MSPLVSYIIPVYNAIHTLSRCVESVLAQNYTEIEIILVDDGSSDGSGELAERYASRETRVRAIRKPNGGVSSARNAGLAAASGELIAFADADDRVTAESASELVTALERTGCDMAVGDFMRVRNRHASRKGDIREEGALTTRGFASELLDHPADFYFGVLWNKLYKRGVADGLLFDESVDWCEDYIWNLGYYARMDGVAVVKTPVYRYYDSDGSLTKLALMKPKQNVLETRRYVYEHYRTLFESLGMCETPAERLRVAGFFLAFASDGTVGPMSRYIAED